MGKNICFFFVGILSGICLSWPGIISSQNWQCVREIVLESNKEPTDFESFIQQLPNRLRLSFAVSPKNYIKRDNLSPVEKMRIVNDACFR